MSAAGTPDMVGLTLQDLFHQVVDDVAVVTGEARDEARDVVAALHRERRQLERGDPALGAPLQRGDVARGQVQPHHLVEVRGGLVGREAQVGGTDLDELAPRAQASQRQRRVGALAITRWNCGGRCSSRYAIAGLDRRARRPTW